jgi:hypothetical protein
MGIQLGMGGAKVYRDERGRYPANVDGGYPILYYSKDGSTLCARCASEEDTSDPVVGADIFYEGPAEMCEDCNAVIESAYGNPDESEE